MQKAPAETDGPPEESRPATSRILQTRLARRYWLRKAILLAIALVFVAISAYLGFVRFPAEHTRFLDYQEMRQLELVEQGRLLNAAEERRLNELRSRFAGMTAPPVRREFSSVVLQVLVFSVFVILVLSVSVSWVHAGRRRFVLHPDLRFETPWGEFRRSEMKGIKSIRWGPRRLAALEIVKGRNGPRAVLTTLQLDGWKYNGLDEIIDRLSREWPSIESRNEENADDSDEQPGTSSAMRKSGGTGVEGPAPSV